MYLLHRGNPWNLEIFLVFPRFFFPLLPPISMRLVDESQSVGWRTRDVRVSSTHRLNNLAQRAIRPNECETFAREHRRCGNVAIPRVARVCTPDLPDIVLQTTTCNRNRIRRTTQFAILVNLAHSCRSSLTNTADRFYIGFLYEQINWLHERLNAMYIPAVNLRTF